MGVSMTPFLFYTKSNGYVWHNTYLPHSKINLAKYRERDEKGLYRRDNINAPSEGYRYELGYGEKQPSRGYRMPESEARRMIEEGTLIVQPGRVPERKRYLSDSKGIKANDVFNDIAVLNSQSKEPTGYPTQKPLALLERIIKASSNEGDMVLDPFCGCATTCVAAEKLDRQWIGIDVSPLAAKLVQERINRELGVLLFDPIHRTDILLDREGTRSKNIKHILYGKQEGHCNVPVSFPVSESYNGSYHPKKQGWVRCG